MWEEGGLRLTRLFPGQSGEGPHSSRRFPANSFIVPSPSGSFRPPPTKGRGWTGWEGVEWGDEGSGEGGRALLGS